MLKVDGLMRIGKYLDEKLVVFLDVQTREESIEALAEALDRAHKLKDKGRFLKAILDREGLASTGIGVGLAVPHAKMSEYDEFFIAIGIQGGRGIEWDSLDGSQVHLIFMIGGPDNKQTEFLEILSQLTTAVKEEALRKTLFKATSPQEVIMLLKRDIPE